MVELAAQTLEGTRRAPLLAHQHQRAASYMLAHSTGSVAQVVTSGDGHSVLTGDRAGVVIYSIAVASASGFPFLSLSLRVDVVFYAIAMPRFRSSSHPPVPSEPLFVLADLQEFGAPGQGGPLAPRSAQSDATTTTTPSPTSSSYKRFSDMSVASALSFRDDTKLDYPRSTTPVLPAAGAFLIRCVLLNVLDLGCAVRPSPPGRQQEMPAPHRMGSFGSFLSPDISLGGEAVSFQNLPIPRRRHVASPDTGSPPASRRNGRIFPPPSSFGNRPFSVMSSSTEQDWLALTAAMRSPRKPEVSPPMRGLDSFSDMFTGEIAPRGMIRDPLSSAPAAVPTRWSARQSGSSSVPSPPFLSPNPPLQQAHSAQPHYRVSFVPSLDSPLSSATSSSSFHTPSFKRGSSSSSANISSPPVTPTSASSSSAPRDAANRPSNAKLHGILEEPLFAEEPAIDYRRRRHARRSTDETETIRLEELLDKEKEDSPALTTRSSPHPPRVELAFIREGGLPPLRSDSLSPSENWKSEWTISPEDPGPSKPRAVSERNPPPRNVRPGRRPPPLQLTSNGQATSSASVSAPAAEGAFDTHSAPRSQRRSALALPALSHLPVSGQKPQRSSVILMEDVLEDAQQFVAGRDTHSPFGRLRSQSSVDSLSPYYRDRDHDPINEPEEGSPYTPRTPEFAPPSEYSPKSIDFPRLSVDSPSPNDPSFSSPPCAAFTPSPSPSPSHHAELEAEGENENERCAWPGVRKWRSQTPLPTSPGRLSPSPSPAHGPAPLSPVISVHSDHSVTGSIRSGITKLLGLGGGGGGGRRSRSGSKSAGAAGAAAEPTRSSDSFDWAPPPPPSTTSTVSLGSLGTGGSAGSKAEERRLRKEAAKARTERLAQELAERARKRAVEGKARTAAYIREKSLRPWEETGAMYQGLSYL